MLDFRFLMAVMIFDTDYLIKILRNDKKTMVHLKTRIDYDLRHPPRSSGIILNLEKRKKL